MFFDNDNLPPYSEIDPALVKDGVEELVYSEEPIYEELKPVPLPKEPIYEELKAPTACFAGEIIPIQIRRDFPKPIEKKIILSTFGNGPENNFEAKTLDELKTETETSSLEASQLDDDASRLIETKIRDASRLIETKILETRALKTKILEDQLLENQVLETKIREVNRAIETALVESETLASSTEANSLETNSTEANSLEASSTEASSTEASSLEIKTLEAPKPKRITYSRFGKKKFLNGKLAKITPLKKLRLDPKPTKIPWHIRLFDKINLF